MSDRTLAGLLGSLPEGVEALPEEHKQNLAEALREAHRRQAAALSRVGDEAMRHIPSLLRPAVRKAMGL